MTPPIPPPVSPQGRDPGAAELASQREPARVRSRTHLRRPRRWPPGRPRILVADSWLANGGDGAISIATDRRLREVAPDVAILHAAYQSDLVGHHYPELDFAPPLAALTGVIRDLPEAHGWSMTDMDELLRAADAVLSQGGGFLIEHYGPWQRLDAYERVLELGLPLGFVAQTIGEFRRPEKRASLSRALRAAAVVGVRDTRSKENVVELGVPEERVGLAADEAFSLFRDPPRPRRVRGVGCVLSAHALVGEDRFVGDEPDLADALAEAVSLISRTVAPEPVTILSTTQGLGGFERGLEDDDALAREVVARMTGDAGHGVRRMEGYLGPRRCAEVIAENRVLVSMRMHPVIFGLAQGVPSVAITRAHKAIDLLAELGLDQQAPTWLDPLAIAAAVGRALEPGVLAGPDLWARLEPLRNRAMVNRELVADLLAVAARA